MPAGAAAMPAVGALAGLTSLSLSWRKEWARSAPEPTRGDVLRILLGEHRVTVHLSYAVTEHPA